MPYAESSTAHASDTRLIVPNCPKSRYSAGSTGFARLFSALRNVVVGRARFELAVSWSQTRRFTELSYRPPRSQYSNRQRLEPAGVKKRPDRAVSIAVLGLLLRRHLAKRPAGFGNQEDRVV